MDDEDDDDDDDNQVILRTEPPSLENIHHSQGVWCLMLVSELRWKC